MSEPINKILATTSQAFTTAQQAQARTNIDAQKSIAYAYSGDTITGIDGSAVGKTTTYGYSGARITSIDGSAVGISTAYAGNGITGNGSSSRPLGISSSLSFVDDRSATEIAPNLLRMSSNAATANLSVGTLGLFNARQEGVYVAPTAMWFTDPAHSTAEVTKAAIERWNAPPYQIKVYKPTTATQYLYTSDYPVYPAGVDGTFVIVNLGQGPYVTYPDSMGATANVPRNQSAQLIWDSQASSWVRWNS